jgi:hypothetical protein
MADSDELEQMVMQLRRRILELEDIIFNHVEQNATSDYPHPFMRVQYLEFAPGLGIGSQLAGPSNGYVLTADDTIKGGLKWAAGGGGGGGGGSVPDASETVKGIAELATQAETDAGVDDFRIVTPKKLANWSGRIIPDATETVKGIAEIATQAETDAGVDDARIVTPKKLANWSGRNIPDATETVKGIAEIATQAETDAGLDDARIVTPKKLANWSGRTVPDATETVKGIAEIATQSETDAGLDDSRIVTPKKLANWSGRTVPDATETVKGIAEIATQSETDTGTDDARIVTPLKLANWVGRIKKASFNVGDGVNTVISITHNFGTRDVVVQVYDNSTYETVTCLVTRPTINTVQLTFISPPSANQFRVLVIGV